MVIRSFLRRLRRSLRALLVRGGIVAPRAIPEPTEAAIRNMRHLVMSRGIGPLAAIAYGDEGPGDPDEYALALTRLVEDLERHECYAQAGQVIELLKGDWR